MLSDTYKPFEGEIRCLPESSDVMMSTLTFARILLFVYCKAFCQPLGYRQELTGVRKFIPIIVYCHSQEYFYGLICVSVASLKFELIISSALKTAT